MPEHHSVGRKLLTAKAGLNENLCKVGVLIGRTLHIRSGQFTQEATGNAQTITTQIT